MPQAELEEEEKEKHHEELQKTIDKIKEPIIYTVGDMNVNLIKRKEREQDIMGTNFMQGNRTLENLSENQAKNRELLVNMCENNEFVIMNTFFQKEPKKKCTFKKWEAEPGPPWNDTKYREIDWIITNKRGKNTIKDIETDTEANIDSDHYPVIWKSKIQLKKQYKPQTQQPPFLSPTPEQATKLIQELKKELTAGKPKDLEEWTEKLNHAAENTLDRKPPKEQKPWITEEINELFNERQTAKDNHNQDESKRITKIIKKELRKEKRKYIHTTIDKDLDIKERWLGIRRLRTPYKPTPYYRKDKQGKNITFAQQAEAAADYLATEQWGTPELPINVHPKMRNNINNYHQSKRKINKNPPTYNNNRITLEELKEIIKRLKRNKAPGPDGITAEIYKAIAEDEEIINALLEILNNWWINAETPEELTKANIASIYKKGNTEMQENYRPISLLQIAYKIFASILKQRIEQGVEEELQATQFGFRKNKSTGQAIHCIRRLQEYAESGHDKLKIVLLDWEKAFDKIHHHKLFEAMERIGIDDHLINITKALYSNPTFRVKMNGHTSEWKTQQTGIRQGCPLSPYLFLIVMTVLFHDIHQDDHLNLIKHRPDNCNFDEILYADDTILASNDTKAINRLLAEIEAAAEQYGLKLNKKKCLSMCMFGKANIHFVDGTKVTPTKEGTYLGVNINENLDIKSELSTRCKHVIITWKALGEFWKHGNMSKRDKITVFNAVIRSKLLYGLESAQLNQNLLNRLNTIQLKGLRQILHITTTYVDRTHTNEYVIEKAQETQKQGNTIKLFSDYYNERRIKYMGHILRQTDDEPEKATTLYPNTPFPRVNQVKRVGKPRINWTEDTFRHAWEQTHEGMGAPDPVMDLYNRGHIQTLNLAAHIRMF